MNVCNCLQPNLSNEIILLRLVTQQRYHIPWSTAGSFTICCLQDRSFEVRYYNATKWVSTKVSALTEHEAEEEGFRRLFRYISGENDKRIQTFLDKLLSIPPNRFKIC